MIAVRKLGAGWVERSHEYEARYVLRALSSGLGAVAAHRPTRIDDDALKVVELEGEFLWHTHPDTDERFLVHGR